MKKRNFAVSMAAVAAAMSGAPMQVFALGGEPTVNATPYAYSGEYSVSTIDASKKGSISLYKYVNNDGTSIAPTGTIQDTGSMKNVIPKAGVVFHYAKVGDLQQITEGTKTGFYYTNLNADLMAIFAKYGVTVTPSADVAAGTAYEAEALNTAMQALIKKTASANTDTSSAYYGMTGEDALRAWAKTAGTAMTATDANGLASVSNLNLGLYMIAETSAPVPTVPDNNSEISVFASPFLVSVPMSNIVKLSINNKTYDEGTLWQYDITAYPKNQSIGIYKSIIADDYAYDSSDLTNLDYVYSNVPANGEAHNDGNDRSGMYAQSGQGYNGNYASKDNTAENNGTPNWVDLPGSVSKASGLIDQMDANIGDMITQLLAADVPALATDIDGTRKKTAYYEIADTMSHGLEFHKVVSVRLGTGAWNDPSNTLLTEGTDYVIFKSASAIADDAVDATDKKLAERNELIAANSHNNQDGGKFFRVVLTDAGLAKMNALGEHASFIYVQFQSTLTKEALIGTDGQADEHFNQNTGKLTYSSDRTGFVGTRTSNSPKIYTYRLNLLKSFTDSTSAPRQPDEDDLSAVKFVVTGSRKKISDGTADTPEDLFFVYVDDGVTGNVTVNKVEDVVNGNAVYTEKSVAAQSGHYRVMDPEHDLVSADDIAKVATLSKTANDAAQFITTDAGLRISKIVSPANVASTYTYVGGSTISIPVGGLVLDGLDAREYVMTEVATAEGRNLLSDPIKINMTAPANATTTKLEQDGKLAEATVQVGDAGTPVKLTETANAAQLQNGTVSFEIKNNETIKLLRTGGAGVKVFYGFAAGAAVLGLGAMLAKKKQDAEAE